MIRNETEADIATITEVTVSAFRTLEISNHTEQFVIMSLRAAKALNSVFWFFIEFKYRIKEIVSK